MGVTSALALLGLVIFLLSPAAAESLKENNEVLFEQLQHVHGLSDKQMDSIRTIFRESGFIGQGNPAVTQHPMTPQGCQEKLGRLAVQYGNEKFEKICRAKYMAPLYNPATEKAEEVGACIDQFEIGRAHV
jgi:hypothetical protein